ncbi:carbohydrate-binding protein [Actinacidiphila soli]
MQGEYVEFTLTQPANSLVLRYSLPDSADGKGIDARSRSTSTARRPRTWR